MNELISRLLVARATGHAPPALIDAVLEQLPIGKPVAECRTLRDFYIRAAADCLTGPAWQRAKTLSALIRRFHHRRSARMRDDPGGRRRHRVGTEPAA